MITVRIPKEIREYKEKLAFGLTARQLIATVIALVICVPTYLYGSKFMSEDVLSWIIILIALPCAGIGFIKKNGMPFEKYALAVLKQNFICPQKTHFKSDNFFRKAQNQADKEEVDFFSSKKIRNYKKQATLEKSFLLEENERKGSEINNPDNLDDMLLTVRKVQRNNPKNNKNKKEKEKIVKKSKAQITTEEVKQKKSDNPTYIPTKKEGKLLLQYAKESQKERVNEIKQGKQKVLQKNKKMEKRRNAISFIPKSTQDDLPYVADYEEGLFEVEPNKYSKCYKIKDINYLTAKEDEAVTIFCKWGEFLNYFSEEMNISLCIDNRVISINEQELKVYYKLMEDEYDIHRKEFNKILKRQLVAGNNDIQQSKYITVTIDADSPYEALLRFHKIDAEVSSNLKKIGSDGKALSTDERLELVHDKMRKGREGEFRVDYDFLKEQGVSSKDYVAPSSFWFKQKDYFMIEDTYYRCMYVNNLPASLSDEFINNMTDCEFPVITTLNIQPVAQEKALRIVKKQLTGMEANKIEAEKKAVRAGYSPETISHDLRQSLRQGEELLDDMLNKNQKMFFVSIMVMASGNSLDELNENSKMLTSKARKYTCQLQTFDNQQREAFKVILPMGITPSNKVYVERTLTTESTSIFLPFASQELFQPGGLYYGLNQISRNLILCNRTEMKTPSGFILGSSGSGKSFACKREMMSVLLSDNKTGLLVIDPENEYGDFCRAFGGTILSLSASSDCHINPMDMNENYGLDDKDNPIDTPMIKKKEKALQKKTEYLMSIIQCMLADDENKSTVTPQQKSIIDRVIRRTYKEYLDHDFNLEYVPTLVELQRELDKEKTGDGKLIAEAVEYYTIGSMNLFSHKSNLDFSNRFVVFNIRDLGKELKQISLLIVLDFIWNRMITNFQLKVRTYCYVDEIHVLFQNAFSERYLQQLYKRGRKYGLVITGITQDVEDLLRSDMARGMISNVDFVMMLNQSSENLKLLAKMLKISEAQTSYISRADAGSGLLFAEKTIVPFVDQFPETSYLYTLMSTKFGEDSDSNIEDFIEKIQEEQKKRELKEREDLQEKFQKVG